MLRPVSTFVAALLMACACGKTFSEEGKLPGISDPGSLKVSLIRTGCYGTCPTYGVEIRGDGTVVYCGIHFVKEVGERSRRVGKAELAGLVKQFQDVNFFALREQYSAPVTDNPTYVTTISYDGKTKSVEDYAGERDGMPAVATELEEAIDRLAGTQEWLGDGAYGYAKDWPPCAENFGFIPPEVVAPIWK